MTRRLSLSTAMMLTVPPLMWAGNAVVGRLVRNDIAESHGALPIDLREAGCQEAWAEFL